MPKFEIEYYRTYAGKVPFAEWFDKLDEIPSRRITEAITRMEVGNLGKVKFVGKGVWERKITFGPGYRIYFGKDGHKVVILLTGGTKRRQSKDIDHAQKLWAEYITRTRE